jgi:hypothetical protein
MDEGLTEDGVVHWRSFMRESKVVESLTVILLMDHIDPCRSTYLQASFLKCLSNFLVVDSGCESRWEPGLYRMFLGIKYES